MSESTEVTPTSPARTRKTLPTWVIILAFVALLGFLLIIALGLRRSQSGNIAVGQDVPAFQLSLFDGSTVATSDLKGKVIVINFWASWCIPCEQEAATLEQTWQYYQPGGQVVFLGIDYVDTEPEALAFIDRYGITYPNGPDLGTTISQSFRISGVPETYIIDTEGKVASIKIGPFTDMAEMQSIIDPLLQK